MYTYPYRGDGDAAVYSYKVMCIGPLNMVVAELWRSSLCVHIIYNPCEVGGGFALAHKPTSHPWLNNNFIECGIHKYIFDSTHNHRCVYLNNLAGCALRCFAMLCWLSCVVVDCTAMLKVLYSGDTDRLFEPTALTARQIYNFRVG